ncbi:MAG: dCMP deaminase family protein [Thermodesulfovibrionales bacterium]|nr:dCMP deaminase family protein [Thermodesulfovibrionales bacterium]
MSKNNGGHEFTRPSWDEYFLEIAKVVSSRSTCIRRRYGAVIVKDNVIISTGYNGAPRGDLNCVDKGTCKRKELGVPSGQRYELCVAVHAEQNAVINAQPERMKKATIYIAGFEDDNTIADGKPCLLCRRMIQNAMIKEVIYLKKDGSVVRVKDVRELEGGISTVKAEIKDAGKDTMVIADIKEIEKDFEHADFEVPEGKHL